MKVLSLYSHDYGLIDLLDCILYDPLFILFFSSFTIPELDMLLKCFLLFSIDFKLINGLMPLFPFLIYDCYFYDQMKNEFDRNLCCLDAIDSGDSKLVMNEAEFFF
jgi:hypothetical protein